MSQGENEKSQTFLERRGFLGVVGASVFAQLTVPRLDTVAADEATPQTKEVSEKKLEPDFFKFEVTIEREEPQIGKGLNLDSAVLSCKSSFGVRAFIYLEPAGVLDYSNLVGRRVMVTGKLDGEATDKLKSPVIRVSRTEEAGLVPEYFEVPRLAETPEFRVRLISVLDVVKDYEAVMTSRDHLWGVFPWYKWPKAEMTIEEDFRDLDWHEREFEKRSSFCYAVFTRDESQEIGCIYVFPCKKSSYDAIIILWVRASKLESGFDQELYEFTRSWMSEKWPFKKVAFPGRDISWEKWKKVP